MNPRLRAVFRVLLRSVVPSAPTLRLLAYLVPVVIGLAVLAGRAAVAQARDAFLSFGRSLDGLEDVLGTTKAVDVNGQRVFVSTGTVPLPLSAVLDRYDADCRAHPSTFSSLLDEAPEAGRLLGAEDGAVRSVLRSQGRGDGVVVCLARRASDPRSARERLASFLHTMDLADIGEPILVYARAVGAGDTHVMTVWSRGSLKVRALFPKEGEPPGTDSAWSARPRNARRVLSAEAEDAPCGVRVYQTLDTPTDVVTTFDADMSARGWTRLDGARFTPALHGYAHPRGAQAIVRASRPNAGGPTIVAVIDLSPGAGRP